MVPIETNVGILTLQRSDNCLHVSVRSRSRRITEVLLRNPKNSKLLYLKNKKGETAYGIDASHDRSLLAQVFGASKQVYVFV